MHHLGGADACRLAGGAALWHGPVLPGGGGDAFIAGALGTIYLGPLVLWSIDRLNFWLLLIAILLIQDYRYDDPPLFGRLVGAVSNARHRHRGLPTEAMPVPDPD